MTTYYKINGTYVSWQEAYNSGYTQEPSNSISYKSAASATWGDSAGNGLMQGDLSDPISGLYFVEGELGWCDIENLSLAQKLYPSTAEDVVVHNTNTGNDSAGVKIESNGDYYYLISGDLSHGWIVEGDLDDLGWEEKGAATLPTVSLTDDFGEYNWLTTSNGSETSIATNNVVDLYDRSTTPYTRAVYNTSKSYAILQWQQTQMVTAGRTEFDIVNNSGYIGAKNVSGSTLSFLQARVAVCSSSDATVEMVLDASNNKYNAFKYTLNGTDYYYVLDGIQNDWTDDLSSIGYRLRSEIVFGLKWRNGAWSSENFNYSLDNNYWYLGILNPASLAAIQANGLSSVASDNSPYGYVKSSSLHKFEVLEVYSGLGENPVTGYNVANFLFKSVYSTETIWSSVQDATLIQSYLCRITPPESLVVILGLRWDGSDWKSVNFDYTSGDNYWWAGVLSQKDADKLTALGVTMFTSNSSFGPYGNIIANATNYKFELLEVYSDLGQTPVQYDLSTMSLPTKTVSYSTLLTIENSVRNQTMLKSWKCRITPKA